MGLEDAANDLMLAHYKEEYAGSPEMQAAAWVVGLENFKGALQRGIEELNKRLSGHYEVKLSEWHVHLHKAGSDNRFTSLYVNTMSRPGVLRYEMFPPSWGTDFSIARVGRDEYKWHFWR